MELKASASRDRRFKLPYRPPFDWSSLLAFFAVRALPGVETVSDGVYRRTIAFEGEPAAGWIEVAEVPGESCLSLRVAGVPTRHLLEAAERTGRLFDLEADPVEIASHLRRDPLLSPLVAARPGLRVAGAWDPFELAVRAILGQQVSVAAARTLAGRLAARFGAPLPGPAPAGLTHVFPGPQALERADITGVGVTGARARTIRLFASAVLRREVTLSTPRSLGEAVAALTRIPGIGPWTAHVIAMRGLGEPDAFPAGDLGVRRALAQDGAIPSTSDIETRAEAWRPWRAYATLHLWAAGNPKERSK